MSKRAYYTIGQMARMNCTSEKALRVYEREGILPPHHVAENGYRYYELSQCATVEMVQQLQNLGISLKQISHILAAKDVEKLENILVDQSRRLEEDLSKMLIAKQLNKELIENCRIFRTARNDDISVEQLPERRIIRYPIEKPAIWETGNADETALDNWELTLRSVKRRLLEQELPSSLFRRVGCMMPKENLASQAFSFTHAFILVDEAYGALYEHAEIIPSGTHLTMHCKGLIDESGQYRETANLKAMLSYASEHGLRVTGEYLGEVVAETPAFLYEGRDAMLKMTIPVEYMEKHAPSFPA